jgi:hypothetical protein
VKLLGQTEGQLHPLDIVHPGGYDLHIYSLLWQAVVPRCAKVFPSLAYMWKLIRQRVSSSLSTF